MNKARLERNIAVLLFIAVLIAFSFADEESKKIRKLYVTQSSQTSSPLAEKHIPNTLP